MVLVRVPVDYVSNEFPRGATNCERVFKDVVSEDLLTCIRLSLLVQVLDCGFVISCRLDFKLEEESHENCHESVSVSDLYQRALYKFLFASFSQVEIKIVNLPSDPH